VNLTDIITFSLITAGLILAVPRDLHVPIGSCFVITGMVMMLWPDKKTKEEIKKLFEKYKKEKERNMLSENTKAMINIVGQYLNKMM